MPRGSAAQPRPNRRRRRSRRAPSTRATRLRTTWSGTASLRGHRAAWSIAFASSSAEREQCRRSRSGAEAVDHRVTGVRLVRVAGGSDEDDECEHDCEQDRAPWRVASGGGVCVGGERVGRASSEVVMRSFPVEGVGRSRSGGDVADGGCRTPFRNERHGTVTVHRPTPVDPPALIRDFASQSRPL